MDQRFLSILRLALHPSTGEGEAAAALNRARAREANCVFADRVLQDLARRFPQGNPFLSRADRDTKRAVAWGKVSQALKRVRG